jgi:ABC-type Fe3+-hydroxamate transport system substrate-binding protein
VTETLMAWGVRPVAVTRFCEQPGITSVGGTKNPDVGRIVELAPDVVVVDREENRIDDARALEAAGLQLCVLHVHDLDGVEPALDQLARAVGRPPSAPRLGLPASSESTAEDPQVRAWVPIWRRPWMTIGGDTYGSTLLRSVGMDSVFASRTDRYPTVTIDEVAALLPEVVLAPNEPYAFAERHRAELEALAPVVFVDGKDLFWWGVRTAAAQARLARLAAEVRRRLRS